jgi:hypothetical protein
MVRGGYKMCFRVFVAGLQLKRGLKHSNRGRVFYE